MRIIDISDIWHRLLVDCKPVPGAEPDYAEYETNRQLCLDGNLPGELRDRHREIAVSAANRIFSRICGKTT